MKPIHFYLVFSTVISTVPALIIGALVSEIDIPAGYATFIAVFGWVFGNMLIRWFNRNRN